MPNHNPDSNELYPFTFRPIFKERVWGGRELDRLYRKALPAAITHRGIMGNQRPAG